MLSDAELRRLVEIEAVLRRDDPAFVRRFDGRRLTPWRPRILALLAILVVVNVTVVALAAGGVVAALVGLSVASGIGAVFAVRAAAMFKRRTSGR